MFLKISARRRDKKKGVGASPFAQDEVKSKLDRWEESSSKFSAVEDSSEFPSMPFEAADVPKRQQSEFVKKNNKAISEYRKLFPKKTLSKNRGGGGSVREKRTDKPTQLKDVFGTKFDDNQSFTPVVYKKSKEDNELITTALKRSLISEHLTPTQLDNLVDAFEPFEVPKGMGIIYQGEKGDYFYVIGDGEVSFEMNGKALGGAKKGDSFGELSLLYTCPRAATVYAQSEPTRLFRVDQKTFQTTLKKITEKFEESKHQALSYVDFFNDLEEGDMKRLGNALTPKKFLKGEVLLKKGEAGDAFYILYEGELKVSNISVGNTKFEDVHLKTGDYFGERALATNEPRAADVEALTDGLVFGIHRKTFELVLGNMSRLIIKAQDRRMLEGMTLFKNAGLSRKDFEELASLVKDVEYAPHTTIFEEDKEVECALFIVHQGSVKLSGSRRDCISPGDCFGQELISYDAATSQELEATKSTMVSAPYTTRTTSACVVGVLTLSDCRAVFDTTKLDKETLGSNHFVRKVSIPDNVQPAAPSALGSQMTQQWLAGVSKSHLRNSVRQEIGLKDFHRHSVLGEGSFGQVYLVTCELNDSSLGGKHHFALKSQLKKDPLRGDSSQAVKREINVLSMMDHPFIVNLVSNYEDDEHIYILMGLVHGGELFDVIHHQDEDGLWSSGIPEAHAKFYAMVISDTLDYIHRRGFAFRDLKPENVLIDQDGYPVLCDFGFGKSFLILSNKYHDSRIHFFFVRHLISMQFQLFLFLSKVCS
jgi:cAMP-dependent protein kinase regulator